MSNRGPNPSRPGADSETSQAGRLVFTFLRKRNVVVVLLMLVAGLGWVMAMTMARFISRDAPIQQVVWGRYAVHLVVLLLFMFPRRRGDLWSTAKPVRQIARGLMMLAMPSLFLLGAANLSIDDVWALVWLSQLLAVGLGAFVLGEKTPIGCWVATALGFLGFLIFYSPSSDILNPMASLLPIGSGLAFAIFQVLSRTMHDEATSTGIFYTALCVVIPLAFLPGSVVPVPGLADTTFIVGMGLSWLAVLVAIDEALKRAPLGIVAPLLFSSLLFKIAIGWLLFGDSITLRKLAAALMVAAGCVVAE